MEGLTDAILPAQLINMLGMRRTGSRGRNGQRKEADTEGRGQNSWEAGATGLPPAYPTPEEERPKKVTDVSQGRLSLRD